MSLFLIGAFVNPGCCCSAFKNSPLPLCKIKALAIFDHFEVSSGRIPGGFNTAFYSSVWIISKQKKTLSGMHFPFSPIVRTNTHGLLWGLSNLHLLQYIKKVCSNKNEKLCDIFLYFNRTWYIHFLQ